MVCCVEQHDMPKADAVVAEFQLFATETAENHRYSASTTGPWLTLNL
jgi:hypothetical protein